MKTITFDGFEIELSGDGGSITSSHKEPCPYCGFFSCEFSCDSSKGCPEDEELETEEEGKARIAFNRAIGVIESLVLAHACAGVNVEADNYQKGLNTVLEAIGNDS